MSASNDAIYPSLHDRHVLVTGGAAGIGAALVAAFCRQGARDLGPLGIRVNSVLPGAIMTRKQVALRLTPESERAMLDGQCLKRRLVPEDVAPIVLFLASDGAGACTNQSYFVDGGWS